MIKSIGLTVLLSILLLLGCNTGSRATVGPQVSQSPVNNSNSFKNFSGLPFEKTRLRLRFEGKELKLILPIYLDLNRYYIPLTEIAIKLKGTVVVNQNIVTVTIKNQQIILNLSANTYGNSVSLKKKAICKDGIIYVSLQDFCKMFDQKTSWDINNNMISLYCNRQKITPKDKSQNTKPAVLRFEDLTAGWIYNNQEATEKLRAIADYLYSENIPFHIAWIPRYMDSSAKPPIDNDLTKQNNMLNANFLFTLDYMLDKNGLLGLHGYTHQYGNSTSVFGTEFHINKFDGIPSTREYVQDRINLMRQNADTLLVPYTFFEAPHYAISKHDLRIFEENFDYIYEPSINHSIKVVRKQVGERVVKYIPTPLDYVAGKDDIERMVTKIQGLNQEDLGSLFYDPYIEFCDITLSPQPDGYPAYQYAGSSGLHKIIKALIDKGYRFVTIKDL